MITPVKQHPLMEVVARKLSGIEGVPRTAQARMVSEACHAARIYHDAEIERLRARVAELEAEKKTCRWHRDKSYCSLSVYNTECGHEIHFDGGNCYDNDAVYCQCCGGEIVEDAQ